MKVFFFLMSVHYSHKGTNSKTLEILFLFNQEYLVEKLRKKCIACNKLIKYSVPGIQGDFLTHDAYMEAFMFSGQRIVIVRTGFSV